MSRIRHAAKATYRPGHPPASSRVAEWDDKFILIDLTEQFLGTYEYGALRFANRVIPLQHGPKIHIIGHAVRIR